MTRAEQAKSAQRLTGKVFTSTEDLLVLGGDTPKRLVNCDLHGLDLGRVDVSYWIFDACDLSQARFNIAHHAEFYSCNLRRARLAGADFRWVTARNCRIDGADVLGIQTTLDCHFWSGVSSVLAHDGYLLLYWLAEASAVTRQVAEETIPARARSLLSSQFNRNL